MKEFYEAAFICVDAGMKQTKEEKWFILPYFCIDELFAEINARREKLGYTDLVGKDYKNETYYVFRVQYYPQKQDVILYAETVKGQQDEGKCYPIELTAEDKAVIIQRCNECKSEGRIEKYYSDYYC